MMFIVTLNRKWLFITIIILMAESISFAEEIRDIHPPVAFPENFLWLVILLVIVIGCVCFIFLRKIFRKGKTAPIRKELQKSAEDIAYERLNVLLKLNLPSQGKIKEYFTQLADIIRRYIEGRFAVNAPEMTTGEFLEFIKKGGDVHEGHKSLLMNFLNCCDMVKFAKYGPSQQEIKEGFVLAKKFVDETKRTQSVLEGSGNVG